MKMRMRMKMKIKNFKKIVQDANIKKLIEEPKEIKKVLIVSIKISLKKF